ncbi:unnamed protein product [Phaeothamnion confervicola]
MSIRKSAALAAVGLWLGLAGSALAAPWKVQPGVGIGPVHLGSDTKVADANFTREETIQDVGVVTWVKYKEGLELHMDRGKILQVIVHSPALAGKSGSFEIEGDGGVKVGSTVQQMEQALGKNYVARDMHENIRKGEPMVTYYAYTTKGVGFEVRAGKIFQIAIWPKK